MSPTARLASRSIDILCADGHYRVIAARSFFPRDRILRLDGVVTETRSRHSLQLSPGRHLVPPPDLGADDNDTRYVWRYLNHSCSPNAIVQGRNVVASGPIWIGDEITFDYTTTEDTLAIPFNCGCGQCGGRLIQGRTEFQAITPCHELGSVDSARYADRNR